MRTRTSAPFSVAHLGFAIPSRVIGHTRVVSMASCALRKKKPSIHVVEHGQIEIASENIRSDPSACFDALTSPVARSSTWAHETVCFHTPLADHDCLHAGCLVFHMDASDDGSSKPMAPLCDHLDGIGPARPTCGMPQFDTSTLPHTRLAMVKSNLGVVPQFFSQDLMAIHGSFGIRCDVNIIQECAD